MAQLQASNVRRPVPHGRCRWPPSSVLAAILLTGGAYFLFSALDAAIKLLVAGVSVWQIMF
ncbi:MAG: hypothetical protein E5V60_14790, partial [Mesorhizobium sp.]